MTGELVGSFTFDEWGVADLTTNSGANHGLQAITTSDGVAKMRFSGNASSSGVSGSFTFLKGSGDYHNLKGEGTYSGVFALKRCSRWTITSVRWQGQSVSASPTVLRCLRGCF